MTLNRKDLAATVVAALVVAVYVANVQDWWYLGGNRWAAITMGVVGALGCSLGARIETDRTPRGPVALLGALGVTSLALLVVAIVTAAHWALVALTIVLVALWAGTTLRHATTPHRSATAH